MWGIGNTSWNISNFVVLTTRQRHFVLLGHFWAWQKHSWRREVWAGCILQRWILRSWTEGVGGRQQGLLAFAVRSSAKEERGGTTISATEYKTIFNRQSYNGSSESKFYLVFFGKNISHKRRYIEYQYEILNWQEANFGVLVSIYALL